MCIKPVHPKILAGLNGEDIHEKWRKQSKPNVAFQYALQRFALRA